MDKLEDRVKERTKELEDALANVKTLERHAADMRFMQEDQGRQRLLERS